MLKTSVRNSLLVFAFFLFIFPFQSALAQSASPFFRNQATTIVGSAEPIVSQIPGPLPSNPTGSTAVSYWSDIFASHLQLGADNYHYTKLATPVTNTANGVTARAGRYVCTGLVIASHRLAGAKVPHDSRVLYMQHDWESVTGGHRINYTANNRALSLVRSGDVFFQMSAGNKLDGFADGPNHVSIVYSISIDSNGDGIMVTREANAPRTSIAIRFQDWQMRSYDWAVTGFNVFLFGLQP